MKTRHQNRVEAIQLLYNIDLNNATIEEAINALYSDKPVNDDAILYVNNVILNLKDIDSLISSNLENYTLDRLNPVDKAILRLATSELKNDVPFGIAINEAIMLTKEFSDSGDQKMVRFTNKVLDKISKSLKN